MHDGGWRGRARGVKRGEAWGKLQSVTYVPGFWSVKGLNSTVFTSILSRYGRESIDSSYGCFSGVRSIGEMKPSGRKWKNDEEMRSKLDRFILSGRRGAVVEGRGASGGSGKLEGQ